MTSRPSRADSSGSPANAEKTPSSGRAEGTKRRRGRLLATAAALSWTELLVLAALALLVAETGLEFFLARLATRRIHGAASAGSERTGGTGGAVAVAVGGSSLRPLGSSSSALLPSGHFQGDGLPVVMQVGTQSHDAVDAFSGAPNTFDGLALEDMPYADVLRMRLFLFQPSGGFNNQRIILERAVRICGVLRRVCVVPMAGRHSSLFANYNKLGADDLMDMDRVLDFRALAGAAALVPTRLPFTKLVAHLRERFSAPGDWHVLEQSKKDKKDKPLSLANLTAWRDAPEPVWLFAGPTMWQRFGAHATHFERPVWPHVHYAPFFRALAIDMAHSLGLRRNFVAVHARQSDHGEKWERRMADKEQEKEEKEAKEKEKEREERKVGSSEASSHGGIALEAESKPKGVTFTHSKGFSTRYMQSEEALTDPGTYLGQQIRYSLVHSNLPRDHLRRVYIATKPGSDLTHFANLTEKFGMKVFFASDVPRRLHEKMKVALPRMEQDRLRADMLGVVEQLMCARAYVFIGFRGSSFSEQIGRLRREPLRNLEVTEIS